MNLLGQEFAAQASTTKAAKTASTAVKAGVFAIATPVKASGDEATGAALGVDGLGVDTPVVGTSG